MTPEEFLGAVLPAQGRYSIVGIRNTDERQQLFFKDITALVRHGLKENSHSDIYFGCASYLENPVNDPEHPRSQANVAFVKALWVDLDVGVSTPSVRKYPGQADAVAALSAFCKDVGLPRPLIVNSGGGVHAYWLLEEAVPPAIWKPLAEKFKAVCRVKQMLIDWTCTADSARIMRLPGTMNLKRKDNPRPCKVEMPKTKRLNFATLAATLYAIDTPDYIPTAFGPLGFEAPTYARESYEADTNILEASAPHSPKLFAKIIEARACAQLTHAVEHPESLSYGMWRSALSIANVCDDRETAILDVSRGHPDFDPAKTDAMAKGTSGPFHCTTFAAENPDLCVGCPHAGRITSPISLGKYTIAPEAPLQKQDTDESSQDARVYTIPAYPFPFERGDMGEILRKETNEAGNVVRVTVYKYPFYAVKRMHDPEDGEVLWLRLHLPKDGVREFAVPLADVMAKDKFRAAIAAQGVAVIDKRLNDLMYYVIRWTEELQTMQQTELIRTQFGWTEQGTFIIGDREIRERDVVYCPPAKSSQQVANMMRKSGDVASWRKLANYYNAEGLEPHAFALFLGFGGPLLRFTNINGGMVNLMSKHSGVGKSTVQMMINSIWGHPRELFLLEDDTMNSRIHRMGVLQNIPVTMDEITNASSFKISELVYAIFSGRGKNRMNGQTNTERHNTTTWEMPVITSSNSSVEDKLRADKAFPDGELARLMELHIERDMRYDKSYTDDFFRPMYSNFGVVGEVYMRYVLANLDAVKASLSKMQRKIDNNASLSQRERIWSSLAAVAMTGAEIAASLGLHDINQERVARWLQAFLLSAKSSSSVGNGTGVTALGSYMDALQDATLVIDDEPVNGVQPAPRQVPRQGLDIRIEPDQYRVFIASAPFRKWCALRQVGVKELVTELTDAGLKVELVKKRMGKGLQTISPPVSTILIHDPYCKLFPFDTAYGPKK